MHVVALSLVNVHNNTLIAVQMDKKSQAVNTLPLHEMTSSSETYTPREWATSFLGEQQELDSIVSDLLTAFSFHTNDGRHTLLSLLFLSFNI